MSYIAYGFTANIDLIGYIDHQFYEQVKEVERQQPPSIITTWEEFCRAVCWNKENGSGAEYIVTEVEILNRLETMLEWKKGIGGTGLQAGCAASSAGYDSLVNIPMMSAELGDLATTNEQLCLTFENEGSVPKHYILEYSDQERSNRIIFRKLNEFSPNLISSVFTEKMKKVKVSWVLLSGFNSFDTSEDIDTFLLRTIEFLASLGEDRPNVHVELASIWSLDEQWKIIRTLRSYVDSVGLNEDEFRELLGLNKDLLSLSDDELLEKVEEGYQLLNFPTLILHTKQFSLVISQGNHVLHWEKALSNGNKLAFSRAMKGGICNQQEIQQFTTQSRSNERGEKLRLLTDYRNDLLIVPGFVGKTVSTIGLGDTFTAGLLAEAPCLKKENGYRKVK